MENLEAWQYAAIFIIFIWSGFVRSGLGFGGAVLSLPFLLLIVDDPLVFLPIVAVHLLIFSTLIMYSGRSKSGSGESSVDWPYLIYTLKVMAVPKLVGVLGLVTLPNTVLSSIIFVIVTVYSLGYVLNKPFKSSNKWADTGFLALGGYVSGTSLIAAPLVMAVYSTRVAREKLRQTLFVLWFVLVLIKAASFVVLGVDFQWIHHLWLLPAAFIGHLLGNRLHSYLQQTDSVVFYRFLGAVLLVTSSVGLVRTWL